MPSSSPDVTAIAYRVHPTGWSAARAAGHRHVDHFSLSVEANGNGWLICRGDQRFDPVAGVFSTPATPTRVIDSLTAALSIAEDLANLATNPRGETFAQVLARS